MNSPLFHGQWRRGDIYWVKLFWTSCNATCGKTIGKTFMDRPSQTTCDVTRSLRRNMAGVWFQSLSKRAL